MLESRQVRRRKALLEAKRKGRPGPRIDRRVPKIPLPVAFKHHILIERFANGYGRFLHFTKGYKVHPQ